LHKSFRNFWILPQIGTQAEKCAHNLIWLS
jgi:hypothetical protein